MGKGKLCGLFGKGRSAIYDYEKRLKSEHFTEDIIVQYVQALRQKMPRLGTRKLYYLLKPQLQEHNIRMGRDQLFALLQKHRLLIRQRRRKVVTTNSRHWMHKYANQVKGLQVCRCEQLWVSDITYIRLTNQWGYLSLITDAYSRKIMGYSLRTDMSVQGCMEALQMALAARQYPDLSLIHHSDRGSQYCCSEYVKVLQQNRIVISMTDNGDPYENALAERMNGIIKSEFNLFESRMNYEQTKQLIDGHIDVYNNLRPHSSCDMLTPAQAHSQSGFLKKRWKKYYRHKTGKPVILDQQPCTVTPGLSDKPVQ